MDGDKVVDDYDDNIDDSNRHDDDEHDDDVGEDDVGNVQVMSVKEDNRVQMRNAPDKY